MEHLQLLIPLAAQGLAVLLVLLLVGMVAGMGTPFLLFPDEEDRPPKEPEFKWPARETDDQRLLRHYVDRHTRFNPVLARYIADITSDGATAKCRAIAVSLYESGELQLDEMYIEPRHP